MADTNPEVERLGVCQYILLTTYKKDGTAVPTPVWVSMSGQKLFVLTEANAGKIKRIRNRAHVVVAPCDARGGSQGASVDASARIVDDPVELARIDDRAERTGGGGWYSAGNVGQRGGGASVGGAATFISTNCLVDVPAGSVAAALGFTAVRKGFLNEPPSPAAAATAAWSTGFAVAFTGESFAERPLE